MIMKSCRQVKWHHRCQAKRSWINSIVLGYGNLKASCHLRYLWRSSRRRTKQGNKKSQKQKSTSDETYSVNSTSEDEDNRTTRKSCRKIWRFWYLANPPIFKKLNKIIEISMNPVKCRRRIGTGLYKKSWRCLLQLNLPCIPRVAVMHWASSFLPDQPRFRRVAHWEILINMIAIAFT